MTDRDQQPGNPWDTRPEYNMGWRESEGSLLPDLHERQVGRRALAQCRATLRQARRPAETPNVRAA